MREPTADSDSPSTGGRIRLARDCDLPALSDLERASFSAPWTPETWREELASSWAQVLIWEDDLAEVLAYAAFRSVAGEAELLRIATTPRRRKEGLARQLLTQGLAELRRKGAVICHLEVRPDNLPAIRLYERLGFRLSGRRPAYYPDGVDALLYSAELLAAAADGQATHSGG